MEIVEIEKLIEDIEKRISNIKSMIVDHNNCSNETSKQVLLAAISRYATSLRPTLTRQTEK